MKELEKRILEYEQNDDKIDDHLVAYILDLESARDEWKTLYEAKEKTIQYYEQELQTLKDKINKLPDHMDDKYDLDNKGNDGYIDDCESAILEINKLIKTNKN